MDFVRSSSRRERRRTRTSSGHVVFEREDFLCAPRVETLETRTLLSVDPVLVTNLAIGPDGSEPSDFVNVNGTLFFRATDGTNGDELWKSDGTSVGTRLVKDVPASASTNPRYLANVNGTLFFSAYDSTSGVELWKSDGTSAGTTLVKNIAGRYNSFPKDLTNVNGTLFFSATDGVDGYELWKSDGTSAGTYLLKDIWAESGIYGGSNSFPKYLTNVNGTLFFSADDDGRNGPELWQSDGTSNGTTKVKDINGKAIFNPRHLTNVNGTLFFIARDDTKGIELWQSDGTFGGTTLVKDIRSGNDGSYPHALTNVNGTLFFTADDGVNGNELWQSDGTAAGTTLVKDIRSGSDSTFPGVLTNVNGTLFFSANNGTNGRELWQSDGTSAGTTLVEDIRSGSGNSDPRSLANVNGTLFFAADDGLNGRELWKADVPADTPAVQQPMVDQPTVNAHQFNFLPPALVKDIRSQSDDSLPRYLTNVNGTLFFQANDGTNGYELWKSDGTAAGTTLVKDIRSGSVGSNPDFLANVNGTLFFRADDGVNGFELWKSDGTSAGTTLVKDIIGGDLFPRYLTNVNGTLFFSAADGTNGEELWQSDGTSAGTTLVKDIRNGSDTSSPRNLTNVNGTLFFTADDGVNGNELWQSDGTSAGTTLVKDILSGSIGSYPFSLTNVNGTLFFSADDGVNGIELWQSDGTSAGTTLVKDILSGSGTSFPRFMANVNGTLFFAADDGVNGSELWQSDGTSAGTQLFKDINGSGHSLPSSLTNVNGTLFFRANDGTQGDELWQSDGTSAGTTLFKDILSGGNSSYPDALTNVNGTLFFKANDGTHGIELWSMQVDLDTIPPVPTMTGPAAITTAQRPTITWNSVSGADHYVVYLRNLATGTNPVLVQTTTSTSLTPTSDLGIGTYEVRVRAVNASGGSSAYSPALSFRIAALTAFSNVVRFQTSAKPSLSWTPLTGAVKYDLWIDNRSTGQQQYVRNTNVTGTSWTSPSNLPMGSYRAWIRGIDASGQVASWSQYMEFFVLLPVTLVSPANPTFDLTPTFTWNSVPGAVSYDLYYRNVSTGTATVAQTGIVGTTFTPAANLPTGSYRWYVLAVVQGGYRSQSSTPRIIFVGGMPTVLTPQGTTSDTTPTFTWTQVAGAARYELWVNRINVATNKIVYQTALTSPSYTPTIPLPVGTYRVWVRAISTTSQASPWSLPVDFAITSVTDEPVSAPGDLLLTHLTLLDAAPLQIGERPSPKAEDATVPTQTNVDRVSEEDSKFSRELIEQRPHETERTSHGSPGTSRSSTLPPLIDINQTAVDKLMADITTMNLLLQI